MSTGSSWQMAFVVRRLGERSSALPLAHANRFSSPARKAHHTVAQQEDLITWVQQHGGYVHPSLRLVPSSSGSSGMGLVSIRPVPSGSALISLPPNLPLAFPSPEYVRPNTPDEALLHLAQLVPGFGRRTMGIEAWVEIVDGEGANGLILVALHKQLATAIQHPVFLHRGRNCESAVCSGDVSGKEKVQGFIRSCQGCGNCSIKAACRSATFWWTRSQC